MRPVCQTEQPAENVVKIPELGVQISVPDSLKDLTYDARDVTLPNGQPAKIAYFSTAALTKADLTVLLKLGR